MEAAGLAAGADAAATLAVHAAQGAAVPVVRARGAQTDGALGHAELGVTHAADALLARAAGVVVRAPQLVVAACILA